MIEADSRLEAIDLDSCRLLILDFDGVVTRLPVDWRALKLELAAFGRERYGREISFSPLESGRERVLRELGRAALDEVDRLIAERELAALDGARLSPWCARLIERHRGRVAVVSSNSRRVLDAALVRFGLAERVRHVVGREDVARTKPSPEGLVAVLRASRCEAEDALFIGDRDVDAQAGEAALVRTLLVDETETERLDEIARVHSYDEGFNGRLARYRARRVFEAVPAGGSLLDLGCGEGGLTALVAPHFTRVTAVDASAEFIARAEKRLGPGAECVVSLLESYETDRRHECILLSGVLEHVADPVLLLRRAADWLAPAGRLIAMVPNARSLHRRIGVAMGLLGELTELGAHDHEVGHRRYYERGTLRADITRAGLEPLAIDGIFLKPLSNSQLEEWPEPLADAFDQVGRELPDWCAELVAVCGATRGAG